MKHWTYDQRSGALTDSEGKVVAHGYSGFGDAKNNPDDEWLHGLGPIPRGNWRINLVPHNSDQVGPYALGLTPVGHDAHGRSAFLIHGDSRSRPGQASHGCIILGPDVRHSIVASKIADLVVT